MNTRIYFDNAASTPLATEVIDKMQACMKDVYGNPSSIHAEGRLARTQIEESRKIVANTLSASLGEVFFTSCGTESNNMILKNAIRDLGVKRIISSPIEHHCVLHSLQAIQRDNQTIVEYIGVDKHGQVNMDELEKSLQKSDAKTLVSLMHANNETGAMLDLEKVAVMCEAYGAFFHSDTVQTIGYYPIDVSAMPIHFISGSAHKFHGPKGIGFVYINGDVRLKPFIDGGAQERNMRSGTENIIGIAGLGEALQLAVNNMAESTQRIRQIRDYFKDKLLKAFPGVAFISPENGHYKILSVSFPATPRADMLLLNLDIAGISASGGSACSSGAEQASHVLEGIKADPDRRVIRFSFSKYNNLDEVDFLIEKLSTMLP